MKILAHRSLVPLLVGAVLSLGGCAPPFSSELLDQVDRKLSFAELWKDPAQAAGRMVMAGGTIVGTRNEKDGTVIEVLQRPLDGEGRPGQTDETGGRFLIAAPEFLDPAVYQRGRSVTVIGRVEGARVQKLGEMDYRYPVIAGKALHLWTPSAGPRFSIGIGVYHGF